MRTLGVPKRFFGKTLDALVGLDDKKALAVEAIQSGRSVFICGPCGTGKTHLACGLMRYWEGMCRGVQCRARFLPAIELLFEIKSTFTDKSESEEAILTRYAYADDLLVLDDVGAEKSSDWSRQLLYLLIDRRYRDCKQTIITSNHSLQELSVAIDDRIASRITEMGAVIELTGQDWRVAGKESQ